MAGNKLQTLKHSVQRPGDKVQTLDQIGSWRAGKTSAQRGYGYRWQKYRIRFLRDHPLCSYCEREGRITAANVVDHITPHQGDQDLFWRESNHQALCKTCHDTKKQSEEAAGGYR